MSEIQEASISTRPEPTTKRVAVFIEANEFFRLQKKVFRDNYLSFDAATLAKEIVKTHDDWELAAIHVYVPLPPKALGKSSWFGIWCHFANNARNHGCSVFAAEQDITHKLMLDNDEMRPVQILDNTMCRYNMLLEVMETCCEELADVIVLVTGDRNLAPLSHRIRHLSCISKRWIKLVSAAPYVEGGEGEARTYFQGIPNSDWLWITREMYEKSTQAAIDDLPTEVQTAE